MPDYEIRFFHADGTLAIVHMSTYDSDDDAHEHAKGLMADHASYEIRRGNTELATAR
jgi:hypothetical protein